MLVDPQERCAVSSLGWTDHGNLIWLDLSSGAHDVVPLSAAKYLSLHQGAHSLFSVVHHFDAERLEITVHDFAEPRRPLCRSVIDGASRTAEGDRAIWASVPRHYVAYLKQPSWNDFALVELEADGSASLQTFEWYDDSYDKGYQGIVGVVDVPKSDLVIISVQRSSTLVLYDPSTRRKVGAVSLAGRSGNPRLFFRRNAQELWADDYDTVVKLDPKSWRRLDSTKLQGAGLTSTMQPIGQFAFDRSEEVCAVARPFSGDVVGLDPKTMKIRWRATLGEQPLEVAVLGDHRVFARDWKTGKMLAGKLG